MANTTTPDVGLADRVTFWRDVHCATLAFRQAREHEVADNLEFGEQSAHDALCVLHALSHAWLRRLGVESYPECPVGDGAEVLDAFQFSEALWANR